MGRRVWIIYKDTTITQEVLDEATANNCPEIASGIPPALEGIITEDMLPCVYEEPVDISAAPRDVFAEIDDVMVRVKKLEEKRG